MPATFALLTVTVWFTGEKRTPDFVGVTVYEPFASPVNV